MILSNVFDSHVINPDIEHFHHLRPEFLSLCIIDMWGQIILCCGELSCAL